MFFDDQLLRPEWTSDRRIRESLRVVAQRAGDPICPSDLLAAVVLQQDTSLERLFSQTLRPPATAADLLAVAQPRFDGTPGIEPAVRMRASFAPAALESLDGLAFELLHQHRSGQSLTDGLELLLLYVLPRFSEQERREWAVLDIRGTLAALRKQRRPNNFRPPDIAP